MSYGTPIEDIPAPRHHDMAWKLEWDGEDGIWTVSTYLTEFGHGYNRRPLEPSIYDDFTTTDATVARIVWAERNMLHAFMLLERIEDEPVERQDIEDLRSSVRELGSRMDELESRET